MHKKKTILKKSIRREYVTACVLEGRGELTPPPLFQFHKIISRDLDAQAFFDAGRVLFECVWHRLPDPVAEQPVFKQLGVRPSIPRRDQMCLDRKACLFNNKPRSIVERESIAQVCRRYPLPII